MKMIFGWKKESLFKQTRTSYMIKDINLYEIGFCQRKMCEKILLLGVKWSTIYRQLKLKFLDRRNQGTTKFSGTVGSKNASIFVFSGEGLFGYVWSCFGGENSW